jgi:hypothetical protein
MMATLHLKARTKPAEEKFSEQPAAAERDSPPQQQGEVQHAAGASPANYGSLREYLKTNR